MSQKSNYFYLYSLIILLFESYNINIIIFLFIIIQLLHIIITYYILLCISINYIELIIYQVILNIKYFQPT
jgi:hypothetical protein